MSTLVTCACIKGLPQPDKLDAIYCVLAEIATGGSGSTTFFIELALSDESSVIVSTEDVLTFRAPYAFTLTGLRASLKTASSNGVVTVDVKEAGVSLLSTKLTVAQGATTSVGGTPPVISDSAVADDAVLTLDIDTAGANAVGLKVTLYGTR